MGLIVEFLIDPAGRSHRGGKRSIAAAVTRAGCVCVQSIDHLTDRGTDDRTVIVTFQPRLLSDAAIITTGNKLAALRPDRIVLLAEGANTQCLVFSDSVLALRTINALASANEVDVVIQPIDTESRLL